MIVGSTLAVASVTATDEKTCKVNPNGEEVHKAYRELISYVGLKEVENKIGNTIPTFGGSFVNQSTIYVYVMDQKDARKVEEVVSPYKDNVSIVVLEGNYTFKQMMKWKKDLRELFFEDNRHLNVTSIDIKETKNKLEIGVEAVDNSKIEAIRQELQKLSMPQEAVDVVETGPIVEEARTDYFDPLLGGIKITYGPTGYCTLGFTATKDGVEGIVTAGHCVFEPQEIYQPNWPWDKIGYVQNDPDGPRYSDSAWIPITTARGITYKTYPDYTVIDHVPSWNQNLDVYICKGGVTTGETCGVITAKCIDTNSDSYGTLLCQYYADYSSEGGDSGSPVYMKTTNGVYLYGVHWGSTGEYGVYSTVDEVFSDLGYMTIHN